MKRFISILLVMLLAIVPAFAQTTFVAGDLLLRVSSSPEGKSYKLVISDFYLLCRAANDTCLIRSGESYFYVDEATVASLLGDECVDALLDISSQYGYSYSSLSQGASGEDVKRAQIQLKTLGFLDGEADGIFGNQTRDALLRFQKEYGLCETGKADTLTQQFLNVLAKDDTADLTTPRPVATKEIQKSVKPRTTAAPEAFEAFEISPDDLI